MYGIVFVVGLMGNTLVIYVVLRYTKMQTVTNLYILNLAVADEFFLIGIPFLMVTSGLGFWPFGTIMCKVRTPITSKNPREALRTPKKRITSSTSMVDRKESNWLSRAEGYSFNHSESISETSDEYFHR